MSHIDPPVSKLKLSLQGIITLLSFASAFPFIQMAVQGGLSASGLSALRYDLAALFFLPFCFNRKYLPEKKDLPRIFICTFLGISCYSFLLNYGERSVSASATSLIVCASPVFSAFLGAFFLNEKLTLFAWIGSFIALSGVAIVCFSHGEITADNFSGPLIVLTAALCTGGYTVLQRPIVKRYGSLRTLGYFTILSAFFLLPFLPSGLSELQHSPLKTWLSLVELVLLPTLIGYGCWAAFCGEIGGAKAGIILYAIPPIVMILSILLEGEIPGKMTLIGGAIVLSGMAVTKMGKKH
ncbi:hypothetical protein FAI41_03575 [Acetobacteraceae bacterium]|nr:hypothetical protein FAI41_03575 [Acetobacteraceae bacterium]